MSKERAATILNQRAAGELLNMISGLSSKKKKGKKKLESLDVLTVPTCERRDRF